jgi:hypothetical protein
MKQGKKSTPQVTVVTVKAREVGGMAKPTEAHTRVLVVVVGDFFKAGMISGMTTTIELGVVSSFLFSA